MLFFRLRELCKGEHVECCLKQLISNELFTKEQLNAWQYKHLKELLLYLSCNNPYYSRYIKEREIDLQKNFESVYDILALFPVTDKKVIKDNHTDWLSNHLSYDNLQLCSTSGSSGIPFKFYQSALARDYKTASKYRLYHRFGIKISDYQLCLGTNYDSKVSSFFQKMKINMNNKYINHRYITDVSCLSFAMIREIIDTINKLDIKSVWGYPSALFEIANYALSNNYPIINKRIKAVIYSGESHTPYMDLIVKKAFNTITIDEYNSVEGFIAGSCKVDNMHLNEDTALYEVLLPDGSIRAYGKGELLITSLFAKDFPFIRYKNGDIVEIAETKCECGSPFKLLSHLDGRSSCFIYNGSIKVPHAVCTHYLPHSDYRTKVDKFQIEQNEKDSVIVRIVLKDRNTDCAGLENLYRELFNNISVCFEYVDDIPRERSGKFKDVINNVKE